MHKEPSKDLSMLVQEIVEMQMENIMTSIGKLLYLLPVVAARVWV